MINNIISAILTFFFIGGMTKNTEDNVRHATWLKTITCLILTIIVSLIYLKTLKVETLMTYVDLREGHAFFKDWAKIKINTLFDGVENDLCEYDSTLQDLGCGFNDVKSFFGEKNLHYFEGLYPVDKNGVYINHYIRNYGQKGQRNSYENIIKNIDRESEGFGDEWKSYYKGVVDSFLIPLGKGQDMAKYSLIYCGKKNPDFSLIKDTRKSPYFRNKSKDSTFEKDQVIIGLDRPRRLERFGVSDTIRKLWGNKGVAIFQAFAVNNDIIANLDPPFGHIQDNIMIQDNNTELNSLNYFTAADISQCKYRILLHSSMDIKQLTVVFNTPVEFSPLPFKVNKMNTYGFEVTDSASLERLRHSNTLIHLKFPEMANKQLVRSLILTTILTALASFFIYNLYFIVRRSIEERKKEKDKAEKNPQNRNIWIAHAIHNLLCYIILGILLYFAIRIYKSEPFYVTPKILWFEVDLKWWLSIVTISFLIPFFYIEKKLYDYAFNKKGNKEDNPQTNSTSKDLESQTLD